MSIDKIKKIVGNILIIITIVVIFLYTVYWVSTPNIDAKEICVFNHNGDTLYFNNSENIKYVKYSGSYICVQDNYRDKYEFINAVIKITKKQ